MFGFRQIYPFLTRAIVLFALMIASPSWAQNIRAQSGIIAAKSGFVRIVSNDIGRIAETGEKIYLDDVVETGEAGKMQIMLMDRTTMTIGPNTSIVIDEFVYDPGVERTMAATVLKGTFKLASPSLFNTGKESREIKLPNAVVAIRGTEILGSISDDVQNVVLLDGAITVANDSFIQEIDRPNFGVSITETGEITPPEFFSSDDLGILLEQLDGNPEAQQSSEGTTSEAAESEEASSEGDEEESGEPAPASQSDENTGTPSNETEANDAPAVSASAESDGQDAAPSFLTRAPEGPAPTETEVEAAAEAVADGSADINDLQVLSRAGPQNIATISRVLGVNIDPETGEASPEDGASFAANVETIITRNGITPPNGESFDPDAPQITFNFEEGSGLARVETFSPSPEQIETFSQSFFSTGNLERLDAPSFDAPSFEAPSFEPLTFDAPSFRTEINTSAFFAPTIEFNPVAFESLNDFTVFEPDTDFFFERPQLSFSSFSFSPFLGEREEEDRYETDLNALNEELDPLGEESTSTLDNAVTEALEEVIDEIAQDTSSVLPESTFMPERGSYRSWNGSEWSTIAQNFNSGIVRFEHNNVLASHSSGSTCTNCSAEVSNTVTIDFSSMEYQFAGSGVFSKPGYNNVTFEATTPNIPLNHWELSSGTIARLPNERELESTFNDPEVYTLTSSSDPSDTVDATIDLDFLYDSQLSDNNDLNSNFGIYGYMQVEYTETGSSTDRFRTEQEAMTPVQE